MIKTLNNIFKQDKEKFVVPKGVQDCIPVTAIYDDGVSLSIRICLTLLTVEQQQSSLSTTDD